MIIFAAGVAASYGGELFEVIRFMEHFDEDEVAFCEDCEAEAAGIEALPCVVGPVQFTYSEKKVNDNKVKAVCGCCWAHGTFKREQARHGTPTPRPTPAPSLRPRAQRPPSAAHSSY